MTKAERQVRCTEGHEGAGEEEEAAFMHSNIFLEKGENTCLHPDSAGKYISTAFSSSTAPLAPSSAASSGAWRRGEP